MNVAAKIMTDIDNKELLLKAIEDYEPYTNSQKKLLTALIDIAIDGSVTISVLSLSKLIGFTRAMVYIALAGLENDKAIRKINTKQARISTFEINYPRLNRLIELYLKKQEYLKKRLN